MAEESFQEKTEPATSRKREEARRKGQVHKSVEMNSAFILVFGLMILYFSGAALATNLASVARTVFSNAGAFEVNQANIQRTALSGFMSMAVLLAPVSLGLMIVGVGANFAQVGYLFSFEAITPKMEKLNPLHGMKRLLISRRSLVELTKNLLKIGIVGLAAYYALRDSMAESLLLIDGDAEGVLGFMARASLAVGFKTGLAFLVLAVLDYIFQRFEYEREMRMTKEEVKEEEKTTEGDPLTRSRIKGVQRKIAYRRMMQDVPGADVVVTNPTHIAVALKYEVEDMSAPRVVAKGADLIAARIREIAQEHGVPIVEDKPLARALYASVEIGDQIPEKLFQAVAQLLAYIYRVKNAKPTFGLN
jgi:flagellar biosynthetic protein FlhB